MYNFYVSKSGFDCNEGTSDKPFATIEKAVEAVRELIAKGLDAPVKVTVRSGEYMTDGIVMDSRDSGTPDCPITYEAEGEVILNGGVMLKPEDFEPLNDDEKSRLHGDASEKVVKADLKKYGLTRADWGEISVIGSYSTAAKYDGAVLSPMWCELFVNDTRMEIARYPDKGFLLTEEPIREGNCLEPTGQIRKSPEEWAAIRNPESDIRRIDRETAERTRNWKTLDNVWIFGYPRYGWADESNIVTAIDHDERTIETKYVSLFGIIEHAPYYFFNVFEELDVPGEWYLARENGILYLYPTKKLEESVINLSITSNNIIKAEGVNNITFSGFSITATRGDAIVLKGNGNTIDGCEIKNVAGWAAVVNGNNCTVKNCHIHHTGKGGITISGGDRKTLASSNNLVTNNHIHHIAEIYRTYQPGVNIGGVNCVVSHNCIHDSAHNAILFSGNDHIMEYNEIYEVCQIADDSGAIYTGRNYTNFGNVIRYNYFHDMSSEKDTQHIGIFAVYCDDNNGGTEIYGNVILRCQCALLLHGGHDMVFKNNLIIDSCKRSEYCMRYHGYGYWETLVKGGLHNITDQHWQGLSAVPWESDIWRGKYPHIAEYLTWDPEHEQRFPHYGDISENIIINHKRIDINFAAFDGRFRNRIKNNIEIEDREFAGIPEGTTLDLTHNRFAEIIPGFEEIPFEKMGLLK